MQVLRTVLFLVLFQVTLQEARNSNWQNDFGNAASFLTSPQGKSMLETLINASIHTGSGSNQLLQNFVSKENGALLGSVLRMLLDAFSTDIRVSPIISGVFSKIIQEISVTNAVNLLSTAVDMVDSFIRTEGFTGDHSDHDWLLPPIIEKFHVLYDIIVQSSLAKKAVLAMKDLKIYKTFADETGYFSFKKFGELMENHSFRKHWIHNVVHKIAQVIVKILDPNLRTAMLTVVQNQVNTLLRMEGFPKSTHLNIHEPVESTTAFINYIFKRFVGYPVQSKAQVKIAYNYLTGVYDVLLFGRYLSGQLNANVLADTLTNILNMEIIEPLAKSFRGYRFAKKHKECDRYVLCLINKHEPHETINLPFLKNTLTKVTSLINTWFLSTTGNTSLYKLIITLVEGDSCKKYFYPTCEGFHAEEVRVKREYRHSEL